MKVAFNDIFELNTEQDTMSPRRVLRLGAMKLLPEHILDLNDTSLGQPLRTWIEKEFDVRDDGDIWTIMRVI